MTVTVRSKSGATCVFHEKTMSYELTGTDITARFRFAALPDFKLGEPLVVDGHSLINIPLVSIHFEAGE